MYYVAEDRHDGVIGLTMVVTPVYSCRPGIANMNVFRLVTFNIAHGRGLSLYQGFHSAEVIESKLKKITKVLTDAEADIVAMQEVDESSFWNKNINLLDVIRTETPYHHSYIGINNTRSGQWNLSYGNALLSRHPIGTRHNQPFSESRLGGKGFMYAEVEIGNVSLPARDESLMVLVDHGKN